MQKNMSDPPMSPPGYPPAPGFAPPPGFAPAPGYAPNFAPMSPPPYQDNPAPTSVVIVGQPLFGSEPQNLRCPQCQNNISTTIETEANTKTHLFALLLCLVGCWCCAPCPYCMDTCLVKKHYCPACKTYLGQSDN